jgi:LmbE family N-acetylglucosaminyl deacetylase
MFLWYNRSMTRAPKNSDIAKLGTILGVWAHPDDEAWCSAGVMAAAVENGQRVVCVTATKGDAGQTANETRWPKAQLAPIRQEELAAALDTVGVSEIHWLDYQDGTLSKVDQNHAVARLVALIDDIKPDTILTFEPAGITGHEDHKTISTWACLAAAQATKRPVVYGACETTERYESVGRPADKQFKLYFRTKQPFTISEADSDLCLRLSPPDIKAKEQALRAHHSQTDQLFAHPASVRYIHQLCAVECFVRLH